MCSSIKDLFIGFDIELINPDYISCDSNNYFGCLELDDSSIVLSKIDSIIIPSHFFSKYRFWIE